jgi:hypothetical protein
MSQEKQFSNKQLKLIILDLYKSNNIPIDENLNNQIKLSSKTQYKTLFKLYNEIKLYIENNISKSSDDNKDDIILEK